LQLAQRVEDYFDVVVALVFDLRTIRFDRTDIQIAVPLKQIAIVDLERLRDRTPRVAVTGDLHHNVTS
jgi:hypothetical protein